MVDQLELEVRQELNRKRRAETVYRIHTILYCLAVFVLGGAIINGFLTDYFPGIAESISILGFWTLVYIPHRIHYYYKHGKGKENYEARIHAEIERRRDLNIAQGEYNDYEKVKYGLSDDGEFIQYVDEDDLYHKPKRRLE